MQLRILGPLEVVRGDEVVNVGSPRQRALLAILLLQVNRVVSVDRLIDQLWGENPPETAVGTLQSYVSNLRRAIEPSRDRRARPEVLVTVPPGYSLRVPPERLDAARFQQLTEDARTAAEAGDDRLAVARLDEALGLWRGEALADFAFDSFAQAEIARLSELRLVAIEDRLDALLRLGQHGAAVPELERLVVSHPLRERLRSQLMLALYRSGRQAEALRSYEEGRRRLADELGIDPSPQLRQLEGRILSQDPALDRHAPDGAAGAPTAPLPPTGARPPSPATRAAGPRASPPPADASPVPASERHLLEATRPRTPLIGRDEDLARLRTHLDQATAGHGRVVLVVGEPGIGKTRLVEELVSEVGGARALWGRCSDVEGAPAFWPWVQILRQLLAEVDVDVLRAAVGHHAGEIAQIVPEIKDVVPDLPAPSAIGAEAARLELYDAVSRLVLGVADRQPLLVVLEDLHWADVASLRLLQFLATTMRAGHLLVVATYRDVDVLPGHPLAESLAELAGEPVVDRIVLGGLTPGDVARCIIAATGDEAPATVVTTVHDRTDGNPFFVGELVRLLASEGGIEGAVAVPSSVRDVIRRRLALLPEGTEAVLTAAAVIGREFDLALLARTAKRSDDDTLDLVEAAIDVRLLEEHSEVVGRYRFAHALVRETLYEGLSAVRRARLHGDVGRHIEELYHFTLDTHLPELSQHFGAAAAIGFADKAVDYAVRAAEAAMEQLGYEDAVAHYERALALLPPVDEGATRRRAQLLISLAQSRRATGDTRGVRTAAAEAARLADELGDATLLANAALGMALAGTGVGMEFGVVDETRLGLLERALDAVGDDDPALRARLLTHLALALYFSPDRERRLVVSDEARACADRVGNPALTAATLLARHGALWGPDTVHERVALAREVVALAEGAGATLTGLDGRVSLIIDLVEAGDIQGVDRDLPELEARATRVRQPSYRWFTLVFRAMRASLAGRYDEGERTAHEALEMGRAALGRNALTGFLGWRYATEWDRGRLADIEADLAATAEAFPAMTVLRCGLAHFRAEAGDLRGAEAGYREVMADLDAVPRDAIWIFALVVLAEVSAAIGDRDGAVVLHELLVPSAEHCVIVGSAVGCCGSVARTLGLLQGVLGDDDAAERRFEEALVANRRIDAPAWVARTQVDLAGLLVGRGRPGDDERARHLLAEARHAAAALGAEGIVRRADAVAAG